jgi:hypothetical protein
LPDASLDSVTKVVPIALQRGFRSMGVHVPA